MENELQSSHVLRIINRYLIEVVEYFGLCPWARAARENAAKALELASRDYKQSLISSQDLMGVQKTRYEAEKLFVNTQFVYFKTLLMTRRQMGVALEKIYAEK